MPTRLIKKKALMKRRTEGKLQKVKSRPSVMKDKEWQRKPTSFLTPAAHHPSCHYPVSSTAQLSVSSISLFGVCLFGLTSVTDPPSQRSQPGNQLSEQCNVTCLHGTQSHHWTPLGTHTDHWRRASAYHLHTWPKQLPKHRHAAPSYRVCVCIISL